MSANEHPSEDELLDHNYDGIQEYDNPLPRWWVYLFWASIVLVPVYYFAPGHIGAGGTKERMYAAEMEAFRKEHPETTAPSVTNDAGLLAMAKDPARLEAGKAAFTANCAACHGPTGGGVIGPNLTDEAWIHGGLPAEIHKTVAEGVVAKGMPAWGKMLKPDQVESVVAYIISLRGTKPANAKAPEGAVVAPPSEGGTAAAPPSGTASGAPVPTSGSSSLHE